MQGQSATNPIGICSWSLRVTDPEVLARTLAHDLDVRQIQLALDPLIDDPGAAGGMLDLLRASGIAVASGMMAPVGEDYTSIHSIRRTGGFRMDQTWTTNQERAGRIADLARASGITLVSMHAGSFVDESGCIDAAMIRRIGTIAQIFRDAGVRVAFETGHEPAADTLRMLEVLDMPGVGVNYDPANILLYGSGDPVDALRLLLPHVYQCHIKDALPPDRADEWGTEVMVGTGVVDWDGFFDALSGAGRSIGLMVERESGDRRLEDIAAALAFVSRHGCGGTG